MASLGFDAARGSKLVEPLSDWEDDSTGEDTDQTSSTPAEGGQDTPEHTTDTSVIVSEDQLDEDTTEDPYAKDILLSYRYLSSRRVDLVGDYAGDELFLIEGDSLLLQCFSDDRLDFEQGFQLLHAVYNVEQFLTHLVQRKCNFHIVFFEGNKHLCIPSAASEENVPKYLCARQLLIRHLQAHLTVSQQGIETKEFSAYDSAEFARYLTDIPPYFLMAHDGAASGPNVSLVSSSSKRTRKRKQAARSNPAVPNPSSVLLREMILHFIKRGYNIALTNAVEWRDTKVMTMVLERHHGLERLELRHAPTPTQSDCGSAQGFGEMKDKLAGLALKLTKGQLLGVIIVSEILKNTEDHDPTGSVLQLASKFLSHQALLAHLPLSGRRLKTPQATEALEKASDFLLAIASRAEIVLETSVWQELCPSAAGSFVDFIDGRLFLHTCLHDECGDAQVKQTLTDLAIAVKRISGIELPMDNKATPLDKSKGYSSSPGLQSDLAVLPFSNVVFDGHLKSIKLQVDDNAGREPSDTTHRIFREVKHWHNAKKPLVQKGKPSAAAEKAAFRAHRSNQRFMAEMQKYAASLTNAVGKSLEPETIVLGAMRYPPNSKTESAEYLTAANGDTSSAASKAKDQQKKGGGGKKAQQAAQKKQVMLKEAEAAKAKKEGTAGDKHVNSWHNVCKTLDADPHPWSRYKKTKVYLSNLQSAGRDVVGAECELYMLHCLLQYSIEAGRLGGSHSSSRIEVAALIWSHAYNICLSKGLTKEILSSIEQAAKAIGLPPLPVVTNAPSLPQRKFAFGFALPTQGHSLAVNLESKEFQLRFCGPYLERSFDSKPDHRVDFNPDGWQREVLDAVDANQSVFAVAPTSAGKTFISFYAMRKVLEADDEGVLVYVAPTKALVNQIAAEIQARYSKRFKHGGKSVWAIHTRDYRINNPTGCQVLVTVPHILQILLLAPSNANTWSSRVRRIIFDEVHSIGQAEDGVVWEQLLLLSPCPIIALSATVGNPEEFSEWLQSTQQSIGTELVTVIHPYRYSDLRKYYYVPPKHFSFAGLPEQTAFGTLGLDHATGFKSIHPVAALLDKSHGIPQDLSLEPRDCLSLWEALKKHSTPEYPVPDSLHPNKALPELSKKLDVLQWEKGLKDVLRVWIGDDRSPYDVVVAELGKSFKASEREALQISQTTKAPNTSRSLTHPDDLLETTLPMLCRLHEQDALPGILFSYDRVTCEDLCRSLLDQLVEAEKVQQKSGPMWERKLERWEEWKKAEEKSAGKKAKVGNKKSKLDEDGDGSKSDRQRDSADAEASSWDSFEPEAPLRGYHFADYSKVQESEMKEYENQLKWRRVPQWLIDALRRGIGVHHAGMNRKYRQVVEMLFRKGFLRVVVATGTLALGINMPCKTVVFSGDSVFLTALNFRQCAGRAGRRGFDLLGNVVFQGISRERVARLISSRLPSLTGQFPISTTLVLRLFTLLHDSKNSKYAVTAINSLLAQPRIHWGAEANKDKTMHHLRFSIEYLRRQYLLGTNGAPLNFAGLVSHLYFTENSAFAFHALLKDGFFHELSKDIKTDEETTIRTLMLVMAHLFQRMYCRKADEEFRESVVKPSSSIVFLPPLPKRAASILREHNAQTLQVFKTYVETFIDQHIATKDDVLPLTHMQVGGDSAAGTLTSSLPPANIRSAFVALSGLGDNFESINDLCQSVREGVFLEEAAIPYVGLYPEDTEQPLNAYLLDFFKHGDIHTIEKANGIPKSDIWFLLNDFSLVLATIIASLMNFMGMKEGSDMSMVDIMGSLDAHEEEEEESLADPETAETTKGDAAETVDGLFGNKEGEGLKKVLKAFTKLKAEFDAKFKAIWA